VLPKLSAAQPTVRGPEADHNRAAFAAIPFVLAQWLP
jgi:hypothetical protein